MKNANELWSTTAGDEPPEIALSEIVERAERLRRKVRFSNTMEYVAGALVVVVFVAMAALPDLTHLSALSRVGAALIACGTIFVLTYLALRGTAGEVRRDASTLACYREEVERRRALLASVPRWYVAPFWPGTALFLAGGALAHRDDPAALRAVAVSFVFCVAINAGIILGNRRAARKLAAELAALPSSTD